MNYKKLIKYFFAVIFYSIAFCLMDLEFWREMLIVILIMIGSLIQSETDSQSNGDKKK